MRETPVPKHFSSTYRDNDVDTSQHPAMFHRTTTHERRHP